MNIFVIGHKSPDLDSVAAAISFSNLKNQLENTDKYKPEIAEEINLETKYVLEKTLFPIPEIINDATDKSFILVDHNEDGQSPNNIKQAKILEILDHHKLNFAYCEPIPVLIKAWGSSCSIIFEEYQKNNIAINKNLATLMLSAILVDTVITKSPTCTSKDIEIIEKLSVLADIKDWKEYGMEIFKVRSSVSKLTAEQIIKSDFKDFAFKTGKFGIGQVETVNLDEIKEKSEELISAMNTIKNGGDYHSVVLAITDIINEGSLFFVSSDDNDGFNKAFSAKLENHQAYIPGIISRKKQITPKLSEVFDK